MMKDVFSSGQDVRSALSLPYKIFVITCQIFAFLFIVEGHVFVSEGRADIKISDWVVFAFVMQ